MSKRVWALFVAVMLLVSLTACGSNARKGQVLDTGWIVRGDADGVGVKEGWHKGFTTENDQTSEVKWYANKFSSSLAKGERVMLALCDLGKSATVWLNGKQIDTRENAMGEYLLDVTDSVKRNGKNILVVQSVGDATGLTQTGLSVRPAVIISDMAVTTDMDKDMMRVAVSLDNSGASTEVALVAEMTAMDTGKVMTRVPVTVQADSGKSKHNVTLQVSDYIPWDYDNPYLYNIAVSVISANVSDTAYLSIGFKELTQDEEGVYALNGNPFMLRMVDMPTSVMNNEKAMRYFMDFVRATEFNAINPMSTPTQALLDYADATGLLVVADSSFADTHVSPIVVDLSRIEAVGTDMQFPTAQPVELTEKWYADMNLDRIYGGAVDAYKAAGDLYVEQLCRGIGQVRLKDTNAIRVSAAIAGYPDTLMEKVNDAIEELRYVIDADDVVAVGGMLNLKIDLVDHNVLWENQTFKANIKITGETGIVWQKEVAFKTKTSALGHSAQLIPLLDESIPMNVAADKYKIAVELTDKAHPVCGEADVYVVDRVDLISAIIVKGALTADAKAAAEAGGKVIVLGANDESNLPISGEFVGGITGAVVDNRVDTAFSGGMISSSFGDMNFDTVFVAEGGTNVLSGFGFTNDGELIYGSVIATYPVGSGSITVVTADVDLNNPTTAALLAAAIA